MSTTLITAIKLLVLLASGLFIIQGTQTSFAREMDNPCSKVETFFARGSGQTLRGVTYEKFVDQLNLRLESEYIPNHYELGTEKYGGSKYKAVKVNGWPNLATVGLTARVSAGEAGEYSESVRSGVIEMHHYLNQRYEKCKSHGSYYILGGYSQGAHVIGNALREIPDYIKDRIVFVAMLGDPKTYFPEGNGQPWSNASAPCSDGKSSWSMYRETLGSCWMRQGSLGARDPYVPPDMVSKTGVWCHSVDAICGSGFWPWQDEGHGTYADPGKGIEWAAWKASHLLKQAIAGKEPRTPTYPIDTKYHFGMGVNGQNVVFLIDTSEQSGLDLNEIRQKLRELIPKTVERNGKFSVMTYTGNFIGGDLINTYVLGLPFDAYPFDFFMDNDIVNYIVLGVPGSPQGATLYALNHSMNSLDWMYGASKSLILITGNPRVEDPDRYHTTRDIVARTALAIDPVNVYPVVPDEYVDEYEQLALDTSGQVVSFTDDIADAMDKAFDKTQNRPVPFLTNTEYLADIGQEITFDASGSYIIDGTITKYEWDFDGDGVFEETTTNPVINHTYTELFDGYMQVRVTGSNDTIANMSAVVKIGTYELPAALASAPENLNITVVESVEGVSTLKLTWDSVNDPLTDKLMLSINGTSIGVIEPSRTTINITDIDNNLDYDFAITALTADNTPGESVYATHEATIPLDLPYGLFSANNTDEPSYDNNNIVTASTASSDPSDRQSQKPTILGEETVNGEEAKAIVNDDSFEIAWYWWLMITTLIGVTAWLQLRNYNSKVGH